MVWFWENSNQNDPTKKLDPELRQYLEQESPAKYTPTHTIDPSNETQQARDSHPVSAPDAADSKPSIPSISLFPDGRYAHIWKTYRPLAEIEGSQAVQSAEKVVEKLKERKDTVHNAAMENCALEHEALNLCFQNKNDWWGMVKARATMCSDDNRKFSRCYTTQAKFLQALGYAASFEWDGHKEERIQMHADTLYHQMLNFERRVEEARAAGVEPPPITSLFNPKAKPIPQDESNDLIIPGEEQLPPDHKLSKRLEGLTPHERELEFQSMKAQMQQQQIYIDEATPYLKAQQEAKLKRQERAISWFGETIGKWIT